MRRVVKNYFSIRYKILAVISLLLVACVAVYLALATHVFKTDKTELIFDLNRSIVSNLSSDLETELGGIASKLELLSLVWNQKHKSIFNQFQALLEQDPFVVYMALLKENSKDGDVQFVKSDFLDQYSLKKDFFASLQSLEAEPILEAQQTGDVIWNATIKDGPPLLGYGRSVVEEGPGGTPIARHTLVAYLRADVFMKSLSTSRNAEVFLINHKGQVLLHPKYTEAPKELASLPIVTKAIEPESPRTTVMKYSWQGHELLGAYSKSYQNKLIVVANTSEEHAFMAAQQLIKRSIVFASAIATLAFIVAVLFSRTLTHPISKLVAGMENVSKGNLNTNIEVSSSDEISIMARSFNSMIRDLKESRGQLEAINRDLEQKVLERTKKLEEQNRAVKDAQEALLRTTRLAAVGEIAGRAAHEVLNPLTNILNRLRKIQDHVISPLHDETELLNEIQSAWIQDAKEKGPEQLVTEWKKPSTIVKGGSLWDEDMQNLKHVYKNWKQATTELINDTEFLLSEGQRINKIVSQMRSLSVVRADKKPHSIHQLLHESAQIMSDLCAREKIQVKESFQAKSHVVLVDKDEFLQSTVNLIKNSIQAISESQRKDGAILISTFNTDKGLHIEITDNGVGITPSNQEKLFTTQFTTKSREEGTGLGLSISRRLIRACGGDISLVESQPRTKTTFTITLPLEANNIQVGAA